MNYIRISFQKEVEKEVVRRGETAAWLAREVSKAFPEEPMREYQAQRLMNGRGIRQEMLERVLSVLGFELVRKKKPGE